MGPVDRTKAALRFFGDDLDPEEISARLGGEPTVAARKGGVWLTPSGKEAVARRGSWRRKVSQRQPGDLDGQIAELFADLTTDLAVWREFATRCQADIFCGLFLSEGNQGFTLKPETLAAIGTRGLVLGLDIYGAELD